MPSCYPAAVCSQTLRETRARIVLDQMYQFVGLLDADGRILEINQPALNGAGLRLDDIRGPAVLEALRAVPPETMATQKRLVERAARGEFVRCDIEIRPGLRSRDDRDRLPLSPVYDAEGAIVFLLPRAVTSLKRSTPRTGSQHAELEQMLQRVRALMKTSSSPTSVTSQHATDVLILGLSERLLADAPAPLDEGQSA